MIAIKWLFIKFKNNIILRHPQPTVKSTILIFGILGVIFLAFGIMFFVKFFIINIK